MYSLRRWLYRPKRSDSSLLAQFYFADEELNLVAAELDSFEGRKDPERCTAMVNQLRACQARVLNVVSQMMDETVKDQRAPRDFRVKFPDDVIQENLAGQLWFGAECLAAGSSIMNREVESACMRPLARALTKNLDSLRTILREQCLENVHDYTDTIKESLIIFDKLFAEFELSYVSAMVPVKTAHEYDMIQEITVLFSETVQRAVKTGLLTVDMIDEYDPALMFTIPRLAIVCGVLVFKDGPLNPDNDPWNISEMFRPFQTLLLKIRELLSILTDEELKTLERALCSQDEPSFLISMEEKKKAAKQEQRRESKEEEKSKKAKKKNKPVQPADAEEDGGSVESELTALEIAERLEALALNFEASRNPGTSSSAKTSGPGKASEADAESKSSEASTSGSESASSVVLSDGENDASRKVVEPESSSNWSEDSQQQLEHFTSQLYLEANLDSQGITITPDSGPASSQAEAAPISDISKPQSDIPSSQPMSASCETRDQNHKKDSDQTSKASTVINDSEEVPDGGQAKGISEAHAPSSCMVKCDSNDSGLHCSDGVSNSDSTFTIASSDSTHFVTSPCTPMSPVSFSGDLPFQETDDKAKAQEAPQMRSLDKDVPSKVKDKEDNTQVSKCSHSCATQNSSMNTNDATPASPSNNDSSETFETEHVCRSEKHNIDQGLNCDSEHTTGVSDVARDVNDIGESQHSSEETSCQLNPVNSSSCDKDISVPPVAQDVSEHAQPSLSPSPQDASVSQTSTSHNLGETISPQKETIPQMANSEGSAPISHSTHKQQESNSEPTASGADAPPVPPTGAASTVPHSEHSLEPEIERKPAQSGQSNNSTGVTELPTHPPTTADTRPENDPQSRAGPSSSNPSAQSALGLPSTSATQTKDKSGSVKVKGKSSRRGLKGKKSASSLRTRALMDDQLLDGEGCNSSETSSYTSECADQEEIALAIEAVEDATRQQVRARFRSSSDMIHRLFVCISGVADQLQTNFAGDLRNILRSVFDMNCSEPIDITDGDKVKDTTPLGAAYIAISAASRNARRNRSATNQQGPPLWVPDEQSAECMSCQVPFSFMRRRHHCRNCGKIFCSRCSSNFVPLPHFGHDKCVRVCNRCFMFRVTPFTVRSATQ